MLAVAWDDLTVAAAFVLGLVMGAVLTVRLTRVVAQILHREVLGGRQRRAQDQEPPQGPQD